MAEEQAAQTTDNMETTPATEPTTDTPPATEERTGLESSDSGRFDEQFGEPERAPIEPLFDDEKRPSRAELEGTTEPPEGEQPPAEPQKPEEPKPSEAKTPEPTPPPKDDKAKEPEQKAETKPEPEKEPETKEEGKKPPEGFVPKQALQEERSKRQDRDRQYEDLQRQFDELSRSLAETKAEPEAQNQEPTFETKTPEELQELKYDDAAAYAEYMADLAEYRVKRAEWNQNQKRREALENHRKAIIDRSNQRFWDVIGGENDEERQSNIRTLGDFAIENGIPGQYLGPLTSVQTLITLQDGSQVPLGEGAVALTRLIKGFHEATKSMSDEAMQEKISAAVEAARAEERAKVTEELTQKFKSGADDSFVDLNHAPQASSPPDGKVVWQTEADWRRLTPEQRERALKGQA